MDAKRLQELKNRFGIDQAGKDQGGNIYDEDFQKIAKSIINPQGTRKAPFMGLSSLLDAPIFQVANNQEPDYSSLEAALIGVPMDLGVTNRNGARFGPRAVRTIERIGPYHHALKVAPIQSIKIADIGDVPFRSRYKLTESIEDIEHFYKILVKQNVIPFSVGGDHSITHPILKAIGEKEPVGLIHFDAHCDTSGPFDGEKFHHGGPFRNAVLDGVLDPARTIQIGIRGSADYLWEFSKASGMTVVHIEDFLEMGVEGVIRLAREVVGNAPCYLSFDVDGLDPSFAPGTGTPEVGGLSPREAQAILRGLAGINLIGGDVVEIAPQYDPTTNTAQVAAQILFEILSLFAIKNR